MLTADHYVGRFGGTIFVDALMPRARSRQWSLGDSCHLFTIPGCLDDLHAFAARIGMKKAWFQYHATMPHYDLTAARRQRALAAGAVQLSRKDTVEMIRTWRAIVVRGQMIAFEEQRDLDLRDIDHLPARERKALSLSDEEVHAGFEEFRRQHRAAGGAR